ncbi:hypothetical protein RUM44_000145 [Polyplax serrata]|uniref:Uncharacterized protein n=1 Tax=Polyplax serrata TaxID=468196 RepID=A0ABR1B4K7_POLSC
MLSGGGQIKLPKCRKAPAESEFLGQMFNAEQRDIIESTMSFRGMKEERPTYFDCYRKNTRLLSKPQNVRPNKHQQVCVTADVRRRGGIRPGIDALGKLGHVSVENPINR